MPSPLSHVAPVSTKRAVRTSPLQWRMNADGDYVIDHFPGCIVRMTGEGDYFAEANGEFIGEGESFARWHHLADAQAAAIAAADARP